MNLQVVFIGKKVYFIGVLGFMVGDLGFLVQDLDGCRGSMELWRIKTRSIGPFEEKWAEACLKRTNSLKTSQALNSKQMDPRNSQPSSLSLIPAQTVR